jgi:Spy/CpxP family protein refolding chaperone
MNCKKLLLLPAFLLVVTSSVYANKMMNVDEKVDKMKAELNLTPDQANQVKPIIQEYKEKLDTIHKDKEEKLSRILSSDQMNQMKAMKKDKQEDND